MTSETPGMRIRTRTDYSRSRRLELQRCQTISSAGRARTLLHRVKLQFGEVVTPGLLVCPGGQAWCVGVQQVGTEKRWSDTFPSVAWSEVQFAAGRIRSRTWLCCRRQWAGIWVGRSDGSTEHMRLTTYGAIPARAVKRLLEDREWQGEDLRRVRGLPSEVREGVEEQEPGARWIRWSREATRVRTTRR